MNTVLIVGTALLILNLVSFGLMAYDKHCAKAGKWRVPEKTLFIVSACFGALGGVLRMIICRHKTRHWYFRLFFPMLLVFQIVLECTFGCQGGRDGCEDFQSRWKTGCAVPGRGE